MQKEAKSNILTKPAEPVQPSCMPVVILEDFGNKMDYERSFGLK